LALLELGCGLAVSTSTDKKGRNKMRKAFLFLVLCLTVVGPCFADTLQVKFSSVFDAPVVETISGSFLWDTGAQTISDISINSTGPFTFLPELAFPPEFLVPSGSDPRPAGSIQRLVFPDVTHTAFFKIDNNQHAFSDVLPPIPGTYPGHFFIFTVPATSGEVVVTAVPEPGTLLMVSLGFLAMSLVVGRLKF
jgi:hypothetical protein